MPFESERVVVCDHPLIQHKLTLMRKKEASTKEFRELVREVAMLETYEATRNLPLGYVDIETPICAMHAPQVERQMVVVPILRAGLGMMEGTLDVMPAAHVGHLGMQRNEETFEPEAYFDRMPKDVAERRVLVVDPMLATGGSAIAAIKYLREAGVKDLTLMVMVAAPVGLEAVLAADADVTIYTCSVDEKLNEHAYIVPGLGDAGDRIFGTL